jgi:ABC-type sugar transport system ATPase subunit
MIKYNFNGKLLNIPKKEIEKSMKLLDLSLTDAIQMWLEDEGYLDNEEQNHLCEVAKMNKITQNIHQAGEKGRKSSQKPKTVKVSDEKVELFKEILENLQENHQNVEILKENKLISVEINGKIFKIDLIEQRKPKN